jgi:branched-chain amino acid transport system permease protein
MTQLLQQVVGGVLTGAIYSVMALAVVLIYRATRLMNFAQGEMATMMTYVGWLLIARSNYLLGFGITLGLAFAFGVMIERGLMRSVRHQEELVAVIVTLGLYLIINSVDLSVFSGDPRVFPQPVGGDPFAVLGVKVGKYDLYLFAMGIALTLGLYVLFQRTKLGLALRATAYDPSTAELMGVPTDTMRSVGWGLAAATGAAGGMLVAPIAVLYPNMMFYILIYAFTAAVLGGFDSAIGAVVGGVILSVVQNLVGTYLGLILAWAHAPFAIPDPNNYRDIVAILLIVVILMVRPQGLMGRVTMEKV